MAEAQRMAPGHPYEPALGTGIAWSAEAVTLWEGGKASAKAAHGTRSPWEFWHSLRLRETFPEVTHWWFRSLWTGGIAISQPSPDLNQQGGATGWVRFDVQGRAQLPWTVTDGPVVSVAAPLPPYAEHPANLPLRISIARAVLLVLRGQMAPETWITVTSLVASSDLDRALPITHDAAYTTLGGVWRLANGAAPLADPPRAALCRLLGLAPPDEAP